MVMSVGLTPNKKQARAPRPPNVVGYIEIPELYFNLISTFYSEGVWKLGGLQYKEYPTTTHHDKYKMLNFFWKSKHFIPINSPL